MLCSEFRKPGGGKGRPGRNMQCIACGITWEQHGNSQKRSLSIAKKRPLNSEELAPIIKLELPQNIVENPTIEIVENPTIKVFQADHQNKITEAPNLDGATSIMSSDLEEMPIEILPMEDIKKSTRKVDLYEIAAEIFR